MRRAVFLLWMARWLPVPGRGWVCWSFSVAWGDPCGAGGLFDLSDPEAEDILPDHDRMVPAEAA